MLNTLWGIAPASVLRFEYTTTTTTTSTTTTTTTNNNNSNNNNMYLQMLGGIWIAI